LFIEDGKDSSDSEHGSSVSSVVGGVKVVDFVVSDEVNVTLFELTEFGVIGSLSVFINGIVFKHNHSQIEIIRIGFRFRNRFGLVSEGIKKVNIVGFSIRVGLIGVGFIERSIEV